MAIIKYKKGNSWFSIPIYVNTGGEVSDYVTKQELDDKGYITQIKKINGQSLVGEGNINIAVDLSNYYTKSDVNGLIPSLDNYYKKSETYSQSEVNALIDSVNAGNVDLSNYYTKPQVDALIPDNYLTSDDLFGYATQTWVNNKNYASASDIPTNVSELINDMEYLTSIPSNYITETELEAALGGVISNNEYVTWNVELIDSSARLDITLFSYNAAEAVNNYSEIVNALENVGSSIQMTGSGFDATLSVSYIEGTQTFGIIKGRIQYGTQTYLLSGKFIAKILTNNNDHIWIQVDRNSYQPVDCLNVTYSQLKAFVDNGVLVPGRKYAITDYTCIYRQPVTNIEMEVEKLDENIRIICTATSSNTLSENVEYVRADGYVPIVECKYSIDPESKSWTAGMTSKSPKGVVWYMKDANGNECNYDFKHVLFRRWAVTDVTPNDASDTGTGNPGAYAYCVTNSCYNWSDNRKRIGSGEAMDKTIVQNVFAGTWARCTTELTSSQFTTIPNTFHNDYITQCHKPYKDTSDVYMSTISWTTDMTSDIGVNAARNHGTCTVYGNQIISVNSGQYKDCYTFDYRGNDASERTIYNTNDPLISDTIINIKGNTLSNTCFIIANNAINNTSTFIRNVYLPYSEHNTFLLRSYANLGSASIANLSCNDKFLYNLFITRYLSHIKLEQQAGYNYICADIIQSKVEGVLKYQTVFGYYNRWYHKELGVNSNLWFSAFSKVKYSNGTSWVSPLDGMTSYDVRTNNFFASNIVGPLQYASFEPHVNRLTFRSIYNKGCRFGSNNQCCSLGECSYSDIGYGGLGQFIKYGKISRSIIPVNSFAEYKVYTSTGVQTWPSTIPTVPDLYGVTVSANHSTVTNISTVKDFVSTNSTTSGLPRKVLYSLGGGNWGTTYEHGLEAVITNTAQTLDLEENYIEDDPPIYEDNLL